MFAFLLFASAHLLNLEVGQAYEIVGQLDCEVKAETIDLHGADSTSSTGSGRKKVSLLYSTLWPADMPERSKKIGLLKVETQGRMTTLEELDYNYDYIPNNEPHPQPDLVFASGVTFYSLLKRGGSTKWDYEERQLLVHGATATYKGVCELKMPGE